MQELLVEVFSVFLAVLVVVLSLPITPSRPFGIIETPLRLHKLS